MQTHNNDIPYYWQTACSHLSQVDGVIKKLIDIHGDDILQGSGDPLRTLINAIVGQQISVSAAESIWKRFCTAVPELTPHAVTSTSTVVLRSTGLSRQKVEYVQIVARAFQEGVLDESNLQEMDDHQIKKKLCTLRGIGPWTADMFLIFHLKRPDVLPLGDLGLVNAAGRLYQWPNLADLPDQVEPSHQPNPSKKGSAGSARLKHQHLTKALAQHAELWRPYRTVATWYIWRHLDADPVIY